MIHPADKPTVAEMVAEAQVADDLSWSRYSVKVLTAVGAAQASALQGRLRLAGALVRFALAHDPRALEDARRLLRREVRRRAAVAGWNDGGAPASIRSLHRLSDLCLDHWVCPACDVCQGRQYTLLPGAEDGRRVLSPYHCHACSGTGKRQIRTQNRLWSDRAREVLELMETAVTALEARVGRKLR